MNDITFFIPSRIYGGAERQMAMLAKLALSEGYNVSVIDSSIGIVKAMLKDVNDIEFIEYDGVIKTRVDNSIIVTQGSYVFCIDEYLEIKDCKLKFWFMHPLNLPHMYLCNRFKFMSWALKINLVQKYYKQQLMSRKKSFFFQARDTRKSVEDFYDIELEKNDTGMLVEYRAPLDTKCVDLDTNTQKIVWLGRLEFGSKFFILKKIFDDLSLLKKSGVPFSLDVIGSGVAQDSLISYADKVGISEHIKFLGHVDYDILQARLASYDILIAQGTSVYEGVFSNIPVVVVDFYRSPSLINSSCFRFFSDGKETCFGRLVNSDKDIYNEYSFNIGDCLNRIKNVQERNRILSTQKEKLLVFKKANEERCKRIFEVNADDEGSSFKSSILDKIFFRFRKKVVSWRS